jgi:hypothetical protein
MTILTAYEIVCNDDIVVTHGGPNGEGKYAGWITRGADHNYRPLLSSQPIFNTAQEADDAMREVVAQAKAFVEKENQDPNNPLVQLLASPEGQIASEIAEAARR